MWFQTDEYLTEHTKFILLKSNEDIDKSTYESELRHHDITVLAIIRDGRTIPNPATNMKIVLNDELICFDK